MDRLIFLVIGRGEGNARQSIEGYLTVWLWIFDWLIILGFPRGLMIRMAMGQRPWRLAAQQNLIDAGVERSAKQTPFETGAYVPGALQFLVYP